MKLKWNYQGEQAQDILIDNDHLLIYQKKEKQAIKGKFNRDTYGQAPIALLSGFGKIPRNSSATVKIDNATAAVPGASACASPGSAGIAKSVSMTRR